MEEEEIVVGKKNFKVRELLAIEFDEVEKIDNRVDSMVFLIKKSANLTDDDYATLTLKERKALLEAINRINGWDQNPTVPANSGK